MYIYKILPFFYEADKPVIDLYRLWKTTGINTVSHE